MRPKRVHLGSYSSVRGICSWICFKSAYSLEHMEVISLWGDSHLCPGRVKIINRGQIFRVFLSRGVPLIIGIVHSREFYVSVKQIFED